MGSLRKPREPRPDELMERRLARERRLLAHGCSRRVQPAGEGEDEEEKPYHFSWGEILAMIIAAYQVILPVVLVFVAVVVIMYLVLRALL